MADTVLAEPVARQTARPPATARRRRGASTRWTLRLVTIGYVGLLVLVPVVLVGWRTVDQGWQAFVDGISDDAAIHAFRLTGIVAGSAVVLNTIFGVGMALLLARYRFPGRRLLSLFIDIPVSISPIVVGFALVLLYGPESGWFGNVGFQVIFATPGMVLATTFVALPLVVRELVPVLEEVGTDQEVAARSLGANAWQRFWRITLPSMRWALAYGVVLSIARSLGEFGAVKVVSGNVSGQTQTVTLLVDERAEQFEPGVYQATIVLVAAAVLCMIVVSLIQPKEER